MKKSILAALIISLGLTCAPNPSSAKYLEETIKTANLAADTANNADTVIYVNSAKKNIKVVVVSPSDTITTRINGSWLHNDLRTSAKSASMALDTTTKGKDYVDLFLLKVNRNKGYKMKQAFENEDNYALLEKRVSYVSFNLGFRANDFENYWLEPIATVDNIYSRSVSTSVSAGHFIRNNMAIGVRFGYSFNENRIKVQADILDIVINAKEFETNTVNNTYNTAVVLKNYIPLDYMHRFFIVSETGLTYSRTKGVSRNIYANGVKIHKVEKTKDAIGIGISPGFMYFMTKGFAFEFAMNPVVAYWEQTRLVNNDVEQGKIQNYGLSFKFMPFNIQFGFAYYFGLDYFKNGERAASAKRPLK